MKKRTFKEDQKKVNELFPNVQKIIEDILKGKIISIEDIEKDSILKTLDRQSGIDAFHISENGIRGIALRIQNINQHNFDTFTIRYSRHNNSKTEYEKRKKTFQTQKEKGYLYPFLTIQAYVNYDTKEVLKISIVKTEQLYNYIENNLDMILAKQKRTVNDGNELIYVTFDQLEKYDGKSILVKKFQKEIHKNNDINNFGR